MGLKSIIKYCITGILLLSCYCCTEKVKNVQQLDIIQRCVGYRVFRSWFRFAGIPNQFLPCPLRYPLGRSASCGVEDSVSYSQLVKIKTPHR